MSSPNTPSKLQRQLSVLRGLTIASLKMYFRNKTALFFSLFFPIMFTIVFGLLFKNTNSSFKVDLVVKSKTPLAQQFEKSVEGIKAFKISQVDEATARRDLTENKTDLQVVLAEDFGVSGADGQPVPSTVQTYFNEAKPQNGQTASLILSQLVGGINAQLTKAPTLIAVATTGVKTKNLTYIDFLLPGMVALSIMQLGIFSVAFVFISFKTTGMLRRIQATPINPANFLAAQGITRLIMAVIQSIILVGIGSLMFGFHLGLASWGPFLLLALLGSAVFMACGFAIAGWAKNEDQVAPVAQLVQFPMMFLSGVFFPRDAFPAWLKAVTDYLPLTYLANAMRQVANDGASLWTVRGDLLGLMIWGIVLSFLAVKLFSWE